MFESVFIFTANAAPLLYYTDLTSALCRSKNPPLVSCLCFSFTGKTDLKVNSVQVPFLQKKEYLLFHSPLRCASVVSTNFQPGKKKEEETTKHCTVITLFVCVFVFFSALCPSLCCSPPFGGWCLFRLCYCFFM